MFRIMLKFLCQIQLHVKQSKILNVLESFINKVLFRITDADTPSHLHYKRR